MSSHLALALLTVPLVACSPKGWLRTPHGAERIRTAYSIATTTGPWTYQVVVLANSHFACGLPTEPDPDAITEAEQDYYMAWNREGALLAGFALFAWDGKSWTGTYPVSETADPTVLDDVEPHVTMAAFHAVWEAAVSEEDGLYREYEPVVEDSVMPVEGPGTVEIEEDGDALVGRFSLDTLDVSGRFRTEPCPPEEVDLLDFLDLFDSNDTTEPTPRDTAFHSGGVP